MTDSTHDTSPTAATGDQAGDKAASKTVGGRKPAARRSSALGLAFVLVLVLAVALGGAAWYLYQQQQIQQTEMASQLRQNAESSRQAVSQVQAMRAQVDMDQARLQQLESQLEAAREQVDGLEQALQMLTANGGELALLNDIDQLVEIAQQQLTLGGNVANAIIALETAQARLARAALPSLTPLQQAVNGDLERLRAVPTTDTAHLKTKLDELSRLVGSAPLLVRDLGVVAEASAERNESQGYVPDEAAPDAGWWEKAWVSTRNAVGQGWHLVSHDLRGLVSVRRIDDSSALLISADQAGQLRDNLRLRLMMAKLALMMRQDDIWRSEIQAVEGLVQSRYDLQTVDGKRALTLAAQLAEANVAVELPEALNSRAAVQTMREAHASDNAAPEAGQDEGAGAAQTPADEPSQSESAPASANEQSRQGPVAPDAQTEPQAAPAAPSGLESGKQPADKAVPAPAATEQVAS